MVIGDYLSAVAVNQVVPTVLVVRGVHCHAVHFALRILRDFLGCSIHIFPCPLVGGILNAVLVENSLVVKQSDCVVILGQSVDVAVCTGVQILNALIVFAHIDCFVLLDIVVEL